MFSKKLFGQRLKECRKKAGETQTQLGDLISVRKSRISEMESGINTTTAEKISLICEHYNISADYLLGLSDDPAPGKDREKL
ncbi:XRE family transcriptional regulator [Pseudoflavonifractor sp. 60]|uniref:helix-turn-helix domain-containing protein n=1 Tax=Pseudoflavonifractor sp. 60 TaxID=2304576 RepID=UPI00136D9039|nr:helix-turn-helix transcriptional regulator [Pseudoflavonifractor sp. 60]NBI67716.1 XRE family transcriptional regulator [Pseudoflavonifractor sp. 60]